MLELENVEKKYQMGEHTIYALKGVTLTIESGDFVAIMGPSGSGKSTLMHVMGLLDVPDAGTYKVNGKEVSNLGEDDLAALRREEIGFIFQQFNLLPRMSALENVSMPLLYSERKMDFERARVLLERVGLGDRLFHKTNEMSGGQQQRVAIARSLINRPFLVLADEPTGNLDSESEKEVMSALKELNASGITVVIVTHEAEIAEQTKRIIRMRDGVIQSDERSQALKTRIIDGKSTPTAVANDRFPLKHVIQYFDQGIKTLATNKVRTFLSMLGILIGVAAVVAMLALGTGAQKAIEDQLSSLGSNLLVLRTGSRVTAGGVRDSGAVARLTIEDANAIKAQVADVKAVGPTIGDRAQITFQNKNWSTQVMGVTSSFAVSHNAVPDVGRFFTDVESERRSRIAVIGRTLVYELFGGKNPIGESIKINKINFQVIGVVPEKGGGHFGDQDDRVLIPLQTAMYRLFGKVYVNTIEIEVASADKTAVVQEDVVNLMASRHRVPQSAGEDAFPVRNMAEIQAALSASTEIMTLLLSIIAAISLLVGGIGIMNIMLVSVTERTREIGLRKAVGAKRWDILSQFLAEAVVVSFVGGTCGVFLAWIASALMSAIAGWATSISVGSVILAFGFSAAVGIVFGFYPARKASLLPPIEALRYE